MGHIFTLYPVLFPLLATPSVCPSKKPTSRSKASPSSLSAALLKNFVFPTTFPLSKTQESVSILEAETAWTQAPTTFCENLILISTIFIKTKEEKPQPDPGELSATPSLSACFW